MAIISTPKVDNTLPFRRATFVVPHKYIEELPKLVMLLMRNFIVYGAHLTSEGILYYATGMEFPELDAGSMGTPYEVILKDNSLSLSRLDLHSSAILGG